MRYKGQCHCGNVHLELHGDPMFTQHCHCSKCRLVASESKEPADKIGYSYTAAYLTKNFNVTQGTDRLTSIVKYNARLYLCAQCRSLIYGISEDPEQQEGIGVNVNNIQFAGEIPASFKALQHIWYQNRVIDIHDDLPKFNDSPKEQGGTGELFLEE